MRVLIFGDSITQGYWDVDGGWVDKLRKHYDTLQIGDLQGRDEPTIFNLGISADNSKDILNRISSETIARTWHNNLPIVIIQIGINDSSEDYSNDNESVSLPIEQYEENLREIVEKVKLVSSKIIFVGLSSVDESKTTPVAWGNFHYTNAAIKRYEDKLKQVATENNISVIPIFEKFKAEVNKGRDLLPDGLHPNKDGHQVIFDTVFSKLPYLLTNYPV